MNTPFLNNIILLSDSYKTSHYVLYPPNTRKVFSYLEARGGPFEYTVFALLQYYVRNYLQGQVVTQEKIDEAEEVCLAHGVPFNRAGWEYILSKHEGRLPVIIKAVPEGSVVPIKNVLMTIENTDPECYWLTNYLETLLLEVWYPTTVATLSRELKKLIADGLKRTSGSVDGLDFKLHDFGFRGCSSPETAAIGSAAHLINFLGTDTMPGLMLHRHFYRTKMAGYSIPATEHSTITSWGKDNELEAYKNLLDKFPEGMVACVSDSYDIWNACKNLWGKELKDKILNRDGVLVVRPDSGIPEIVVPKVIETLMEAFGYTTNEKGFKVLPPQVRVIQGDGVTFESISKIIENIIDAKISIENITFGMGGGLLQKVNRDTQQFAFKCSAVDVNGKWHDVYKQPVDAPNKNSKKGRLKLIYSNHWEDKLPGTGYQTVQEEEYKNMPNLLETVFENGYSVRIDNLENIRLRAKI